MSAPETGRNSAWRLRLDVGPSNPNVPNGVELWHRFAGSFEVIRQMFEHENLASQAGFVCLLKHNDQYWSLPNHHENHNKVETIFIYDSVRRLWRYQDCGRLKGATWEFVSGILEQNFVTSQQLLDELVRELQEEHPDLPLDFFVQLQLSQLKMLWRPAADLDAEITRIATEHSSGFLAAQWQLAADQSFAPRGLFRAWILELELSSVQFEMLKSKLQVVELSSTSLLRPLHAAALKFAHPTNHV